MNIRIAIIAVIIGVFLIIGGRKDFIMGSLVKPEPQVVTCEQLLRDGPGDNYHIRLTDFVLSPGYVYEQDEGNRFWNKVWVPVYAKGQEPEQYRDRSIDEYWDEYITPGQFQLIVELNDIKQDSGVADAAMQSSIQGVLVNEIRSVHSETKQILREGYPGVDIDSCWFLVRDMELPGQSTAYGKMGGGAAAVLFGIGLIVVPLLSRNKSRDEHGAQEFAQRPDGA